MNVPIAEPLAPAEDQFKFNLNWEKSNLDGSLMSLCDFLDGEVYDGLDEHNKKLLSDQYAAMKMYSTVLGKRIAQYL